MADLDKLLWGDRSDPRIELEKLFPSGADGRLAGARSWAAGVLAAADVPADDELRVIKTLRDAEPRLSLKPARYLAAQLAR
ncbi:hypothetical protein [Microbacterium hibisci]|uniref:hypothetical protein n=1 Tax=Microbacterium hibisci TaxID=2036000 RepID=UPI001945646E|nr:hypothetical protein [Microbacterium hibisci]